MLSADYLGVNGLFSNILTMLSLAELGISNAIIYALYKPVACKDEKRIASIFKAFCDENRIRIIKLLRSGEKCACKLLEEINVTQPTLSHHMKILCDAEIVVGRKEGKWTHYSISEKGVEQAKECLRQLTTLDVESENKSCCEK